MTAKSLSPFANVKHSCDTCVYLPKKIHDYILFCVLSSLGSAQLPLVDPGMEGPWTTKPTEWARGPGCESLPWPKLYNPQDVF